MNIIIHNTINEIEGIKEKMELSICTERPDRAFDFWGRVMVTFLNGAQNADGEIALAIMSTGILHGDARGWAFSMPSTQEVIDFLFSSKQPTLQYVSWSGEIKEWDGSSTVPQEVECFIGSLL